MTLHSSQRGGVGMTWMPPSNYFLGVDVVYSSRLSSRSLVWERSRAHLGLSEFTRRQIWIATLRTALRLTNDIEPIERWQMLTALTGRVEHSSWRYLPLFPCGAFAVVEVEGTRLCISTDTDFIPCLRAWPPHSTHGHYDVVVQHLLLPFKHAKP